MDTSHAELVTRKHMQRVARLLGDVGIMRSYVANAPRAVARHD